MGLYSAIVTDERFYQHAQEGRSITIDPARKVIAVDGCEDTFSYKHSMLEETLLDAGGIVPLYERYGKGLFSALITPKSGGSVKPGAQQTFKMGVFQPEDKRAGLEW